MGEIINQGFAFIWLPDELPFCVPKDALQKTADSLHVHKASRVEGNVPIFSEDVQFAMPAQKKLMHDSARSSKKNQKTLLLMQEHVISSLTLEFLVHLLPDLGTQTQP